MVEAGVVSTIIDVDLALGALETRRALTGTLADSIDRYSAIQTLDVVDLALVDVVLAVGLGRALGTVDAFVAADQVLASAAIVTRVRVALVLLGIAVLARPARLALALKVARAVDALAMNTGTVMALVYIDLAVLAIIA